MVTLSNFFKGQEISAKRVSYRAGDRIFSEAEPADGMYLIEKGEVKITKNSHQTRGEVTLATLGPEDFFGILSFTSGRTRQADATALTDCTLWEIDKRAFKEAVERSPEFSLFLINGLVRRLETLNERMREMSDHLKDFTTRMEDLSSLWHSLAPVGGLG